MAKLLNTRKTVTVLRFVSNNFSLRCFIFFFMILFTRYIRIEGTGILFGAREVYVTVTFTMEKQFQ